MSDFTKRLADLSPEKRALLALRQSKALAAPPRTQIREPARTQAIPRRSDAAPPPLSLTQEEWWARIHTQPDGDWGCIAGIRIKGPLKVAALEQSFNEIVRRH